MNAIDKSVMQLETGHTFGRSNNLVGIAKLAAPAPAIRLGQSRDLCVIMLTAGMLHNAGPYRLHVELAQSLGDSDVSSFRFDLSGIGESLAVGSSSDSTSRAVDETKQAIDFLQEKYGFNNFALFGLCSGADDSLNVALADNRVRGVVMLDGCGYRTPQYHFHRLVYRQLPSLLRREKVVRKARSVLGLVDSSNPLASLAPGFDIREFPDRNTAQTQLQSLVDRGTSLLSIYTGGVQQYYNHSAQFKRMFPDLNDRGRITVQYHPEWDHVLYLSEDRMALIDEVVTWVSKLEI
jgi:hypothetical protein